MKNITYILGAGASANALPVVKNLDVAFAQLRDFIDGMRGRSDMSAGQKSILSQIAEDVAWVRGENNKHASIDTFAKKLYLKGKSFESHRLKIIMSMLFGYQQTINPVDFRYDSFFASLIQDSSLDMPKNIRVLSWNYDQQFELGFAGFTDINAMYPNEYKLNITAKNYRNGKKNFEGFSICKLNGTATFVLPHTASTSYVDFINESILNPDTLIQNYKVLKTYNGVHPSMSFAWEKESEGFVESAIEQTKQTDVLVVIGYSFPFFNRDVDRIIIKGMPNLKKVYFQAPDAEILKERFLAIRADIVDLNLIERKDVNQFLIPDEY